MQPFDIDVEIGLDLARSRASDALADTLDYAQLHTRIVAIVRDRSYVLLERLADEIARAIIADERTQNVAVRIAKPRLLDGATPSVTVRLARG